MAGRKKRSNVEIEVKMLAQNFFNVKVWQRKDVSTGLAKKKFGISPTRVFRLLKGMEIDYQNEPFNNGISVEEKTEYLLKNLRAYEVVAFFNWYNDIKNKKAPKKATYNLSPEGKIKILEKQIQKRERNKELVQQVNSMQKYDTQKNNITMISEVEKARLSGMTRNIFTKTIISEIRNSNATRKQQIEFIDNVLPSVEEVKKIALSSQSRIKEQLKIIAVKVDFYYTVKKIADADLIVKGQSKNMEDPLTIFDREWDKQERKTKKGKESKKGSE